MEKARTCLNGLVWVLIPNIISFLIKYKQNIEDIDYSSWMISNLIKGIAASFILIIGLEMLYKTTKNKNQRLYIVGISLFVNMVMNIICFFTEGIPIVLDWGYLSGELSMWSILICAFLLSLYFLIKIKRENKKVDE